MVLCEFKIELGVVWGVLGRFGVVWVWGLSMDPFLSVFRYTL